MADYLKSTNFATKDALPSGNAGKIVKGTEIDTEFNAIVDAIESKADLLNPVFSGLLTTDTLATVGAANIGGSLAASGAFSAAADAQFTGTGRLLFPRGTTAQRPASPTSGSTRYNTDLGYLENYTGTEWRAVGYVTPADVSDKANTSTGYFQLPVGSSSQRPVTPTEGLVRYNSELDLYEGYINGAWYRFVVALQGNYTIDYLLVAGGGGAADIVGTAGSGQGGGGAGGLVTNSFTASPTSTYTIVIGAGGSQQSTGANTYISGIQTAYGGGGGNGGAGGSGGGGQGAGQAGGAIVAAGQGNVGGNGLAFWGSGGGGGGAGAAGQGGAGNVGGAGGAGLANTLTGTTLTYAGGGGGMGAYPDCLPGAGGSGGGGSAGTAGTVNTGGGGGAQRAGGGQGGSGVVILSMPTVNYSGNVTGLPTVTTVGSNTVVKFTNSGTYVA
jgi:hypothetical protein